MSLLTGDAKPPKKGSEVFVGDPLSADARRGSASAGSLRSICSVV